jgi:hypothetical protein
MAVLPSETSVAKYNRPVMGSSVAGVRIYALSPIRSPSVAIMGKSTNKCREQLERLMTSSRLRWADDNDDDHSSFIYKNKQYINNYFITNVLGVQVNNLLN